MNRVLVAHRGTPLHYPENSLEGFRAALESGAKYLEIDIQVTADGIAVLSHDPSTLKMTGTDLEISTTDFAEIAGLTAGYPERFGDRFGNCRIRRLDEFVALLLDWPDVRVFVELKQAGIEHLGTTRILEKVLGELAEIAKQCILISFNHELLLECRKVSGLPIGWVLPEWSEATRAMAEQLEPEFLFCNRKRLPPESEPLWQNDWRWVLYTANDPDDVQALLDRGADMVETDTITTLI